MGGIVPGSSGRCLRRPRCRLLRSCAQSLRGPYSASSRVVAGCCSELRSLPSLLTPALSAACGCSSTVCRRLSARTCLPAGGGASSGCPRRVEPQPVAAHCRALRCVGGVEATRLHVHNTRHCHQKIPYFYDRKPPGSRPCKLLTTSGLHPPNRRPYTVPRVESAANQSLRVDGLTLCGTAKLARWIDLCNDRGDSRNGAGETSRDRVCIR